MIDKHFLLLEEPDLKVRSVAFWIRLLDLPFGFQINRVIVRKLGDAIGSFRDVDCGQEDLC